MSIKETLQHISNCDLYIGNDTGWAHISVALKIKALTIFCDSPVAAYGSYSSRMTLSNLMVSLLVQRHMIP